MYLLKDIINIIEEYAPPYLQESYDNSGLIVGDKNMEIKSALICLDCTEQVIDEAIEKNCALIIAHHPIVFSGLKSITGKNYIERVLLKAIKHDIAIYAAHTNLDNVIDGVNCKIAKKLGLKDCKILEPKTNILKKLYVYVPNDKVETVRSALFKAGAGNIGNYSECSFNTEGTGTFLPNKHATPVIGEKNEFQQVKETKVEVIFTPDKEPAIIHAMMETHPYEEVAYEIIRIDNKYQFAGAGMIGELETEMDTPDFLAFLKKTISTECIRYTEIAKPTVKKIAVCGGAGSFLLKNAINAGADVFITADFKYHQFFDAEGKILIADVGHYESEQFTGEIFYELFSKKMPNFALHLTSVNTNPIKYYK